MKHRKAWSIGFTITMIIVALAMYALYTYRVNLVLPEFTLEVMLILAVFSFPASYIGRWVANYAMKQSTNVGDVFKETVIGITVHWCVYLPTLMTYNYVVFGRIMSFPSLEQLKQISGLCVLSTILIPPLLVKFKHKKKWFEETKLKDMEAI